MVSEFWADFFAKAKSFADGKIHDYAKLLAVIILFVNREDGNGGMVTPGGLNHQRVKRCVTCVVKSVAPSGDPVADKLMVPVRAFLSPGMCGREGINCDSRFKVNRSSGN